MKKRNGEELAGGWENGEYWGSLDSYKEVKKYRENSKKMLKYIKERYKKEKEEKK